MTRQMAAWPDYASGKLQSRAEDVHVRRSSARKLFLITDSDAVAHYSLSIPTQPLSPLLLMLQGAVLLPLSSGFSDPGPKKMVVLGDLAIEARFAL